MPESGPDGSMDLLAQAVRKVYDETFGDAAERASDDTKPADIETHKKDQRPTGSR